MIHPGWLAGIAILLWATGLLPEFLTALLFFAALMILHAAPPEIVFSGFLSAAFWLVLSGFILGAAVKKVGLADRIAISLIERMSGSWTAMVFGVVALTYGLAFVMPSNMGRVTLLMPIVMALADRAGLPKDSRGRHGLALAVGFGTYELSGSILPANVPNLILTGAVEKNYGLHFSYLPYLLLHAPILGILRGAIIAGLIAFLFPEKINRVSSQARVEPLSAQEWRLAILLLVTLAFWMTDSLHGIQPAWVGLAAACFCLLPRVGFLNSDEFAAGVNVRTCVYVAGVLSLATVVAWSGLGDRIGQIIIPWLPIDPNHPARSFGSIVLLGNVIAFGVASNGLPAVFTPLAQALADHSGLALTTVLMAQVISYSTALLPYQAAPIVVAMGMEKVPMRDGVKCCLIIGAITLLVLMPLDYLWFRLLGWR
jgi:anion transporter